MNLFYERLPMLQPDMAAVTAVPFDEYASFLRGAAEAPPRIWEAFFSESANTFAENGIDLRDHPRVLDLGPVPWRDYLDITTHYDNLLPYQVRVLTLGGDHSITYPVVRAFAKRYPDLTILQLDAHNDLYDELDGNRYSHACPFARIMEEGLARRLVQVGIRTMTAHQREQARRFGVEVHELRHGLPGRLDLAGPLYLSLDLDVLDPAFAPGISHYAPGGLATREVLDILHRLPCSPLGADLVELNPDRDLNGMTAMVAAKLVKEILARMLG
jgi:arginase